MDRYSLAGGDHLAPGKSRTTSRRRPGLRRAALCFLTIGAAPLLLPYAGSADEPSRQGWWWQGNQGGTSAPAPPDVPADGLYVQGGTSADAPFAYAAVLFNVGQDQKPKKLTLHLAQAQSTPDTTAVPALPVPAPPPSPAPAPGPLPVGGINVQACPIPSGDFGGEQGGPLANAPAYSCTTPIAGTADLVAGTVTFDASSLGAGAASSTLALAILPVSTTDRAAFQHPGPDALEVESTPATSSDAFAPATDDAFEPAPSFAETTPDAFTSAPEITSTPEYTPGIASTGTPAVAPTPKAAPRLRRPPVLIAAKRTTAVRIGELAALGMVVAALLFYSRGYGLLGGRFADE
jgi:hypothetical protein